MADNGFTVHARGASTAQCPFCDAWFSAGSERHAGAALVAHLNFTHIDPPIYEDL